MRLLHQRRLNDYFARGKHHLAVQPQGRQLVVGCGHAC